MKASDVAEARRLVRLSPFGSPQLDIAELPAPHYVLDVDVVRSNYSAFRGAFPDANILYALKANPDHSVLGALAAAGCGFEAASWFEIETLLSLGIEPERITFGTSVKSSAHVARAMRAGVSCCAADSEEELHMLSVPSDALLTVV